MIRIIGVRFRNVGKVYYFDPADLDLKTGDYVIVETARGVEYGKVVLAPREVEEKSVVQPLKPVLRVATPKDRAREENNRKKEREAYKLCQEKIRARNLDMKLIDAEYTFDNSKVLFYFTADGRVDFRELVKDLAFVFKTRIELRQIGVRDETKILGGMGICGRPLCCHTYLSDFIPVSIRMAKEQNLSLNPAKISGTCGRLMCCLKNEQDTYEYLNKQLPKVGDLVLTPDGVRGEVHSVNVLRQTVKILIEEGDEKELQEYPVGELKIRPKNKKNASDQHDQTNAKDGKEEKTKGKGKEDPEKKTGSEGSETGSEKQKEKEKNKGKDRSRNRGKGTGKDRDKERDKNQNKEQSQNREPGQNKEQGQEGAEAGKGQGRERSQEGAESGKGQGRDRSRNRSRSRDRGKEPNPGKESGKEPGRETGRESGKEPGKERRRSRDRRRERGSEQEGGQNAGNAAENRAGDAAGNPAGNTAGNPAGDTAGA